MISADLLKHRLFPDLELMAGGAGLNRELTAVSVIDSPDVDRWMRGGEFLIGSGYIFKEAPDDFIPFLRRVKEKEIAALGIKLDRYIHQLSSSLVSVADELELPLFRIPLTYRWTDVIEIVHSYLAAEKQRAQSGAADIQDKFTGDSFDVKGLLLSFAQQLQRPILVCSEQLNLNYCFTPDGKTEDAETCDMFPKLVPVQEKALPMHGQIIGNLEFYGSDLPVWNAVYRILSDTPITLRIRLAQGESMPSARQERLALRAITMLRAEALEIAIQFSKQMAKRERFFESLCLDVYSDTEMVQANISEMKIQIPKLSRIAMVSPIEESSPLQWNDPTVELSYKLGNIWVGLAGYQEKKFSMPQSFEDIAGGGYYISLGGLVKSPLEIGRSYREARKTLSWARSFSLKAGIYHYGDLSLYAMLDSLPRLPESGGVWKRYWEPLVSEVPRKKSISMRELAVELVETDFNARTCSSALHLHYNTVRNYIEELEHLLSIDLKAPHHRIGLILAYYIDKSRRRSENEFPASLQIQKC